MKLKSVTAEKLTITNFVSAPVGSGKTYSLIDYVCSSPADQKFVIGTPNTTLSMETAAKFTAKNVTVIQIDSRDGANCKDELIKALEADVAKVIIANRDVILKLDRKHFGTREIVFDEIMNPYERIDLSGIVISKASVKTYYRTKPSPENPEFLDCFITAEGIDLLAKYRGEQVFTLNAKDTEDEDRSPLIRILEKMANNHYRVVIEASANANFIDGDGKKLSFFTLAKPTILDGYHSCTIMGANFEDSLLFLMWQHLLDFQPHPVIKGDYQDFRHKAKKVKLFYFSNMNCTKYLMEEKLEIGVQGFLDRAAEAVLERFGAVDHIFCVNNATDEAGRKLPPYTWKLEERVDGEPGKGKRVSPDPNGINSLQDRHMAIHMAALNFSPMDFRFFEKFLGIDPAEAVQAMTMERIAQFVGRTSIRDRFNEDDDVTIIVFDLRSAEYLQKLIGCKDIEMIDLGIPELFEENRMGEEEAKRAHVAAQTRYRDNKATEKRLADHAATPQQDGFGMRILTTQYATDAARDTRYGVDDIDGFVSYLRKKAGQDVESKDDLAQIRVGLFDDLNNHRTADNIISSNMIFLDVDRSTRPPNEISTYLSSLAIEHVIVHSFSSKLGKWRFHLFIPLDSSVNVENYAHIAKLVMADLDARFPETIKWDKNYKSINLPISVPCKSKFGADVFIYAPVWKDVLTREHRFLNVVEYLNRRIPKREYVRTKAADKVVNPQDAAAIQTIINEYALKCVDGERDKLFGKCVASLFFSGYEGFVIEAVMGTPENLKTFGKAGDTKAAERMIDWCRRQGVNTMDMAA